MEGQTVTPAQRRAPLLEEMQALGERGIDCRSCCGLCCTHAANSMRITRQEALDMQAALIAEQRWTEELFERLQRTVSRYRLDQEPGDGRRIFRKTYTCPFFKDQTLGCSIPATHKPYGCLAFNANVPGQKRGGNCSSDAELLERVQESDAERLPIPLALLALRE